jgi:iron complex outermembrane receptor protein
MNRVLVHNFRGNIMVVPKNLLKTSFLAAGIAAMASFVSPLGMSQAYAQDEDRLEEITVTARKREESLLEIPLAITAFSAERIENLGITRMADLVEFSPGFHYGENSVGRGGRFNRRLIFRAMNPRTDRQTRQGATVFIDGAPTLGSEIGRTENYERIEVIKGPQSAYFGRSTFSGAINAITRTPGNDWAASISADVGSFGMSDINGQIEGPLVEDKLAFRLSASQYSTDGEYNNRSNPGETLGSEKTQDVGLSLYWTPTDNFSAKFRARQWQDDDGPSVGVAVSLSDHPEAYNCTPGGPVTGTGEWICGEVPYFGAAQVELDTIMTDTIYNDFYNPAIAATYPFRLKEGFGLRRDAVELSLVLDWEFGNGMSLSSITAIHENEYSSFEDVDRRQTRGESGSIFGFNAGPGSADSYQLTFTDLEDMYQEFRLSSATDQKLQWMFGVSYSEQDYKLVSYSKLSGFGVSPSQVLRTHDPETSAIFGSINWQMTDQLELSVEARQQADKVIEGTQRVAIGFVGTTFEETFDSFTPRVILDWQPRDNSSIYLSYALGTNPGQFNAGLDGLSQGELDQIAAQTAGGAALSIPEEEIENIEFGAKTSFWDGRGQISAAVYYADWTSIPIAEIVGYNPDGGGPPELIQVNGSGGQADLSGIELEGSLLAGDHWMLEGTFSLTQSDIGTFVSSDASVLIGDPLAVLGNEFSRYPEQSGTLSATYSNELSNGLGWYTRGDYIYRGSTWMTNANLTKTSDSSTFNLRIGLEGEQWRVEGYALNLFEEEGYNQLQLLFDLSGQSGVGFGPRTAVGSYIPKQAFGVRATFDF